ncbi:MAG: transglutaminase domain-containing protein [Deltaproteobacteria bacterium]|nr:transglutaminase domain-containing protein [Deltaproteobacteria bacterium]
MLHHRALVLVPLLVLAAACSDVEETVTTSSGLPPGPQPPEPVRASLTALLGPGGLAAVPADLAAEPGPAQDPTPPLTPAADAAVARAPAWVRVPLRLRLAMLEPALQDKLAALVVDAPEDRLIDEIAFSIANVQETDLGLPDFDPAVFTENAQAIYDYDALLDYAEVIDVGTPGQDEDFHSTVRYRYLSEGEEASFELPPEHYYWWVVHPKLDFEELVPVDPAKGKPAPAPAGVHWRRYLMDSSTSSFDYRDHYLIREPVDLRKKELKLAASAHLTDPQIYPLRVFVDEAHNGLLVEVDLGQGTLLASTLDLAGAYADGETGLMVNLCSYGNTNFTLKGNVDIALVMDEVQWGSDVYAAALAERKLDAEVHAAAELAGLDLSQFDKIIIAADQSAAFYEKVAGARAALEQYVSAGGVLQLDLHAAADISALEFPNDIHVAGGPPAKILPEGQPRLREVISGTPYVWDGGYYDGLSGDRPPPQGGMAMDHIGWFVTQNMYDNVAEYSKVTKKYNPERSWYPQRIIHNHYGNCGELGDMIAAAGRAALLPVRVLGSVEDHCWNDVFFVGRWVPWQVDWSDGPTRIDNPYVGSDEDLGGGKTLSGLYNVRGDGYPGKTPIAQYSDTVSIDVGVRDLDGRPVDGAMVLFATEQFYDKSKLDFAGLAYSGGDGRARIELGDSRNYWFYVASEALQAEYPPADGDLGTIKVEPLVTADQTEAGATITKDIELGVTMPLVAPTGIEAKGEALARAEATVLGSWIVAEGFLTKGRFIKEAAGATARFYLLDDAGYQALRAGQPFGALAAGEDAAALVAGEVAAPAQGPVWLVALNPSATETLQVALDLELRPPLEL